MCKFASEIFRIWFDGRRMPFGPLVLLGQGRGHDLLIKFLLKGTLFGGVVCLTVFKCHVHPRKQNATALGLLSLLWSSIIYGHKF